MIIVEIAGHLGADPETRVTPSGQKVTNLRVAVNVNKEETLWWRVTIWGSDFDNMIKHLKKGSAIIAVGDMGKLDIYNDKQGAPQISYQMTARMLKFSPFGKGERSEQQQTQNSASSQPYAQGQSSFGTFGESNHAYSSSAMSDEPPF